ncbi:ABC transporter permease [Streptomyces himalayensis]|uniref:ABC-2 family transporter protein n=1 Tax=Streptomyces himalayensis subsp. himalayensis TaxID=2756131 RepID=A0A7W0DTD0_9ACTN|nr:ABC-2 family transporter protein [Streptomyces himalayensis]MBA2950903.1 ABC-2 family transporter protein [Streptomyces himalayensis subsp. himalayensis]
MKLLRLLGASFSMSLRRSVAFRINLVFDVLLAFAGLGTAVAAVLLVFTQADTLAGWSKAESLVLIGTYQLITALRGTFIDPNLSWFPETGVRNGKLDGYLLQPASSLFLASLSLSSPLALIQLVPGLGVLGWGIVSAERPPSVAGLLGWLLLVAAALVVTWALSVLLACLAFWASKLQLDVFYHSAWQLGRYPTDIFSRPLRLLLTYVFPMALIASVPSATLLRGPRWEVMVGGVAAAGFAALLAVTAWSAGLRRYTGATS